LITVRGVECIQRADVVVYDYLVNGTLLRHARPDAELIFVGKQARNHTLTQDEINALLVERGLAGKIVTRLKGGDPFVFGRGSEEAEELGQAGIPFEIVPGISSSIAAPAYAGIPVTHRAVATAFMVITGHEDPLKPASTLDWSKLADPNRTLVVLMGIGNLRAIAQRLVAEGLPETTPAAAIADGTRPTQRTVRATLATIAGEVAAAGIGAPAIVVIGTVADLRERLRWFDTGGLFGKRVLVTRAGEQAARFARDLLARGAEPVTAPTIAIEPPDDDQPADAAVAALATFAWVVFTSQNGVDAFFARLRARGADARALNGAKVAAIGERTADRLREYGIAADAVPQLFVAEEVARIVLERCTPGERVLVFRAQEARDVLPRALEAAGIRVVTAAAYKTVVPRDPDFAAKATSCDVLTFTSASTVRGFAALLGGNEAAVRAASGRCVACIGPITAQAAAETGLAVDVVAATYTTAGLLDALDARFAKPA